MINDKNMFSSYDNMKIENNKSELTISSNQGKKFKKYQNKITNNIAKKTFKEGFSFPKLSGLGLTAETNKIIDNNDYSDKQEQIDSLRQEYDSTLIEYENLVAQITGTTNSYINRVSPNNPYLNKNVCLSNGACGYVTNQGVFKWYPADNNYTYNSTVGKNGCPNTPYIQIQGEGDIFALGSTISSNPQLIVGKPMVPGQSCGNEGQNVFVNELLDNPTTSYVGCYSQQPPVTEVMFVPTINSSNLVNGYLATASSIYQGNNQFCGPWAAFNQNPNDYWHSEVSAATDYNSTTGNYEGNNQISYTDDSGQTVTIMGEWLEIILPDYGSGTYATKIPLTKYDLQGRQDCCGSDSNINGRSPNSWVVLGNGGGNIYHDWHVVDKQENQGLDKELRTYTIQNPKPYYAYILIVTNCGDPRDTSGSRYCVQISQWNLYTTSSYNSNDSPAMTNVGIMNFEQCRTTALNTSNKYFSLNSPDQSGNGTCFVSNELSNTQMYGEGLIFGQVALWDTKTYGSDGKSAIVTNGGSLSVLTSTGQSIYSSPAEKANPGNYIGCYNDCAGGRALPTWLTVGSNAGSTYDSCSAAAKNGNWKYFGLQFTQANGTSECWVGNDLNQGRSQGKASNCITANGVPAGGSCSNAIYNNVDSSSYYYLILQDDGNMCIYRGSGPNDNQGLIWASDTVGKQLESNPNFSATKGQFKRNYIVSGETLLTNQFIGNTNGSIYLIMQSDGNLVLYTNQKVTGCSINNGNNVGSQNINAVNQINDYSIPENIGKLAFVDSDSTLHEYSNDNQFYKNTYSIINNANTPYNDIPYAAYGGATVERCESSCNSNPDCAGFVFDRSNSFCWPKTNQMFPYGHNFSVYNNSDIYIRDKMPKSPPIGVTQKTSNIDTIRYNKYVNGGQMNSTYGLANVNSIQKQQLEQLQNKLNLLSTEINGLTDKFGSGSTDASLQSRKNVNGINNYLKDINKTNMESVKIGYQNNNGLSNILKDSDIVVLQKNYDYLFWSILAAGSVLITMNIIKK
jgi:hypothetical protein